MCCFTGFDLVTVRSFCVTDLFYSYFRLGQSSVINAQAVYVVGDLLHLVCSYHPTNGVKVVNYENLNI